MKPRPTTHLIPLPDHGTTPCCGKTPFELPIGDRLAVNEARVTCGKEGGDE